MYFKCSNAAKATSHQQEFVDPHDGVRHVEASVNVTRQDVEEFFGDKYTCTCLAWSSRGKIRSRPATVQYACEYHRLCSVVVWEPRLSSSLRYVIG